MPTGTKRLQHANLGHQRPWAAAGQHIHSGDRSAPDPTTYQRLEKHENVISEIVQISILRNGGNLNGFVPILDETDPPRLYPILNHVDGEPVLTTDLQTCHQSWETDYYLEEHPYIAVSFVLDSTQYTKALKEPFPPAYPAHEVLRHAADAIELLQRDDAPRNDWEKATMRHQVELTIHKALAGVHSLADGQVQMLFYNLLLAEFPSQTMLQALHIATGNDPLLKRVVTDRIDFPQIMVFEDDAKHLLEQAPASSPQRP